MSPRGAPHPKRPPSRTMPPSCNPNVPTFGFKGAFTFCEGVFCEIHGIPPGIWHLGPALKVSLHPCPPPREQTPHPRQAGWANGAWANCGGDGSGQEPHKHLHFSNLLILCFYFLSKFPPWQFSVHNLFRNHHMPSISSFKRWESLSIQTLECLKDRRCVFMFVCGFCVYFLCLF